MIDPRLAVALTKLRIDTADAAAEVEDAGELIAADNDALRAQAQDAVTQQSRLTETVNSQAAALAALRKETDALRSQAGSMPVYTPGTPQKAGAYWRLETLTAPLTVTAPGQHFVGGLVVPSPAGMAVTVRPGADDVTFHGTRFSTDGGPAKGRLGVKPCLRTLAKSTHLILCEAARVDTFVEAYIGSDGTLLEGCIGTDDLRATFFYGAGAKRATLRLCVAKGSHTENLVRLNVESDVYSEDATVEFCDLANDEGPGVEKAVIEFRHVRNAVARGNVLRSYDHPSGEHESSCIGVGDKDLSDGGFGAEDVWILDNDLYFGHISVHSGARQVTADNNRLHGLTPNKDVGITANGKPGTLTGLRLFRNVGYVPAATSKAFVAVMSPENVPGLIAGPDNRWEVTP